MDVWPKVRERPSDSTFILESHACLSPPLDVHSFSQLALPCGAEYFSLAGLVFFLIPTSKKTGEGKEKEKKECLTNDHERQVWNMLLRAGIVSGIQKKLTIAQMQMFVSKTSAYINLPIIKVLLFVSFKASKPQFLNK